jgi:hypothetical protein
MHNEDMTRKVRLAVLQQLAESGRADQMRTATLCPGSDGRDMVAALEALLDEGLLEPALEPHELVAAARSGAMTLTEKGRHRLSHDAA